MITRIKGKDITNFYSVKTNKTTKAVSDNELKTIYTARPELVKEAKVEWKEICNFEGEMSYDETYNYYFTLSSKTIHISEDEKVNVDEVAFRADLNEKHAFTDKVLCELDDPESKLKAEILFETELSCFNAAMINSNDAMLTYCKLHKLLPEGTDCIELFKLVYPGETYEIVDGEMKKKETCKYRFNGWVTDSTATAIAATPSLYSDRICALESSVGSLCTNNSVININA